MEKDVNILYVYKYKPESAAFFKLKKLLITSGKTASQLFLNGIRQVGSWWDVFCVFINWILREVYPGVVTVVGEVITCEKKPKK